MRSAIYISTFLIALLLGIATSRATRWLLADNPVTTHEQLRYIGVIRNESNCLKDDYALVLYADGTAYHLPGGNYKTPARWGKFPVHDYDDLAVLFESQDFRNLKGAYVAGKRGVCVQAWGIRDGNIVCDYPGKVPAPVAILAREIDDVAQHVVWDK